MFVIIYVLTTPKSPFIAQTSHICISTCLLDVSTFISHGFPNIACLKWSSLLLPNLFFLLLNFLPVNRPPFQKSQSHPNTTSSYFIISFVELAPTHNILCLLSNGLIIFAQFIIPFLVSLPSFSNLSFLVHLENDS